MRVVRAKVRVRVKQPVEPAKQRGGNTPRTEEEEEEEEALHGRGLQRAATTRCNTPPSSTAERTIPCRFGDPQGVTTAAPLPAPHSSRLKGRNRGERGGRTCRTVSS